MARSRFLTSVWNPLAFWTYLGYHHILMGILAVSIILQALLLSGCSSASPFGKSIYVASFHYRDPSPTTSTSLVWENVTTLIGQATGDSTFEVRANYFALCARSSSRSWTCASSSQHLATAIPNLRSVDPLSLTTLAARYRSEVLFPGLLIGGIAITIIVISLTARFPGWHEEISDTGSEREIKPFPSRNNSYSCLAFTVLSAMFALMAALWQHTSAATADTLAEALGGGAVEAQIGSGATALAWLGFGLLALVAVGFVVMIASIYVLDKLTEYDDEWED